MAGSKPPAVRVMWAEPTRAEGPFPSFPETPAPSAVTTSVKSDAGDGGGLPSAIPPPIPPWTVRYFRSASARTSPVELSNVVRGVVMVVTLAAGATGIDSAWRGGCTSPNAQAMIAISPAPKEIADTRRKTLIERGFLIVVDQSVRCPVKVPISSTPLVQCTTDARPCQIVRERR